ncbi:hypothetical protein BV20DRAFT_1038871 [Pilatotrama ljubarskyi]|nr:hypothetical protein BV20DRAFT_1038871 [Pilatotrama ljubarskyi]
MARICRLCNNRRSCNADSAFIPVNQPPEPLPDDINWSPLADRPSYKYAKVTFEQAGLSKGIINQLLRITAAKHVVDGMPDYQPIYTQYEDINKTIDVIPYGPSTWKAYSVRYHSNVNAQSASWKRVVYFVYTRNTLCVAEALAGSPDFKDKFDVVPFEEYMGPGCRRVCNLMSGQWAYRQADKISQDPATHGAMLLPVVAGADKTTVSIGTGNQAFHPVYMSLGNIHNDIIVPVAFLPIPAAAHECEHDEEFRIFEPLRPGMLTPHVLRCPNGHYHRGIFELDLFIADYPEQVYLSGVVQGWCPRCLAIPTGDFLDDTPRSREHTDALKEDVFGINCDVKPFTSYFPRADIHELLTPDLLHQVIKGTFKDHLVTWVVDYIKATADSECEANHIIDDIDQRLAVVPSFPGLRRFPQGRNFKQWTGNHSKALMKIFLLAIAHHVPPQMVQCITTFLDWCYLARRSEHDTFTLAAMDEVLARFYKLRKIFEDVDIRPDGFALPRQHALVHYTHSIRLFGSPNGLCSSITESRHITAVKRPWRESNRNNPLGQILRTLTHLAKLAAAHVEFGRHNMLYGDVLTHALLSTGLDAPDDKENDQDARFRDLLDAAASDDVPAESQVFLSMYPAYRCKVRDLAGALHEPQLLTHIRRFVFCYEHADEDADEPPLADLPFVWPGGPVSVYHSTSAMFYAPSEAAGPHGMHRKFIRCNPSWYTGMGRYDTVLVNTDGDAVGMDGMTVARVRSFFSFTQDGVLHECALVEWFELDDDTPDEVTGMWIVRPSLNHHGERVMDVISLESIVRACHLIGVYGTTRLPADFDFTDSLDAFRRYYVNWYADYHAHETIS